MKTLVSTFVAALFLHFAAPCMVAVTVDDFLARTFTNAQGVLPYRLFIPTNYNPAIKSPLVIFLHGSGERGSDNRLQLVGQTGALVFASETNQLKYPSFMIAPQCPSGGAWADSIRRPQVFGLVNSLVSEFNIDIDRLYITGLSMGGYGTWDYILSYTNMYAAAIPMSAGGDTGLAGRIINLPIWNFHSATDGTVSVSGSRAMVQAIRSAGGNVIYTEYASGGHVVWTPAYNTPTLMDWVYGQRRGSDSTNAPLLKILTPTDTPSYATAGDTLTLTGTGSTNASITSVVWTNYQGATVSGTAAGTTDWTISNVPIDNTLRKLIVVIAKGTSWSTALGGFTTFNDTLTVTFRTVITSQPKHQTLMVGGTATFTVLAESTNTLGYQWRFNGIDIPGATGPTYTVNNARTNDAGSYSVLVSASEGDALSTPAYLFVLSQAKSVVAPPGLVNWWPGEGNVMDIFGDDHGTPQGGTTYAPGKVAQGFEFDGLSGYINVGAASIPPPWTVCMWVKRQNAIGSSAILMGDGTQYIKLEQYNGTRSLGITRASVADYSFGYVVPVNTWTHLAFVGTSTNTMLYVNGTYRAAIAASISLPRSYIGSTYISGSAKFIDYMKGDLDELLVFNRILSGSEINGICSADSAGLVRLPEVVSWNSSLAGDLTLTLKSQTGKTLSVYTSSNLVNWEFINTLPNPGGMIQVLDTTTNSERRFYRFSQP